MVKKTSQVKPLRTKAAAAGPAAKSFRPNQRSGGARVKGEASPPAQRLRRGWLLKSEPWDLPWSRVVEEKDVLWDNIRNHQANNNMKAMKQGDLCLFYHSVEGKAVFGIAEVLKPWQPDPTDPKGHWGTVRLGAKTDLNKPVTLAQLKAEPRLKDLQGLRQTRLSVSIVTKEEWDVILELAETEL